MRADVQKIDIGWAKKVIITTPWASPKQGATDDKPKQQEEPFTFGKVGGDSCNSIQAHYDFNPDCFAYTSIKWLVQSILL